MLAEITSRRRLWIAVVLGIGLLIVVCAGAWWWSGRSDLQSVYAVAAGEPLEHVVFSPNGQVVATTATNGTIQLWRAADGTPLRSLHSHVGSVAIAFHPDSTQLVSAGDNGTVQLWQVATGQSLTTLWPPARITPAPAAAPLMQQIRADEPFSAVTFSPDSQLIAAGTWHGWVVIFQATTGQVVSIIQAYPELAEAPLLHPMTFIAVSPNNQWLLTNSLKHLKLWHLPDRRLIQDFGSKQIQNVPFYAQRGAFTPDTTQLWLFDDGGFPINATPLIWSLERQSLLPASSGLAPSSEGFAEPAYGISSAISADRQLLAFGGGIRQDPANYGSPWLLKRNDSRIIVWQVGQEQPLYTLREHTDNVMDLAFSPDSHFLASVSVDGTLRLWRLSE